MTAFDAMPQEWREFCANYGRTARGESLAGLLAAAGGDIEHAKWSLQVQLPVEPSPRLQPRRLKPIATYDLKAEQALGAKPKPKRKRKRKPA